MPAQAAVSTRSSCHGLPNHPSPRSGRPVPPRFLPISLFFSVPPLSSLSLFSSISQGSNSSRSTAWPFEGTTPPRRGHHLAGASPVVALNLAPSAAAASSLRRERSDALNLQPLRSSGMRAGSCHGHRPQLSLLQASLRAAPRTSLRQPHRDRSSCRHPSPTS